MQTAVTVAYTYGWRMQSEVLALERRHVDLETGTLTLDSGIGGHALAPRGERAMGDA